jgi:hypothetical protein
VRPARDLNFRTGAIFGRFRHIPGYNSHAYDYLYMVLYSETGTGFNSRYRKTIIPPQDLDAGPQISVAISHKNQYPLILWQKKDFTSRLEDITQDRTVNRDGIRIYG